VWKPPELLEGGQVNTIVALLLTLALACPIGAVADDGAKTNPAVGAWQGTLPNGMGGQIRVVLKIRQTAEGAFTATMDSPDQNASDIPVASITVQDRRVSLDVAAVRGSYEGTLDAAKNEIDGTWKQSGQSLPLLLRKDAAGSDAGK
jgi:hypothetical protein